MTAFQKRLIVVLLALAVLSPVGLYLPSLLKAGSAWGEWSAETVARMIGFMPEGLKNAADLWKAPFRDYNLGDTKSSPAAHALSYIFSGIIGVALCILILYGLSKLLVKKK